MLAASTATLLQPSLPLLILVLLNVGFPTRLTMMEVLTHLKKPLATRN